MKDEEVMKRLCFPCVGERHGNEETLDFWPTPCLSNIQPRFHLPSSQGQAYFVILRSQSRQTS